MSQLLRAFSLIVLVVPAYAAELERPAGLVPEGPSAVAPLQTPQIPTLPAVVTAPSIDATKTVTAEASASAQATPAQAAANMTAAVAAQAAEGLKPTATAGDSREAAANVQAIVEGRKPADAAAGSVVVASQGNLGPATLSASQPAASSAEREVPAPASSVKAQRKAYNATRAALAAIAAAHGVVASLPVVRPELVRSIKEEASYKNAVISDIDDTLDPFNTVFSKEAIRAIVGVRTAGKFFAAITDRPDQSRPGSSTKSAFETFSSIPKEDRVGMVVATNGGGKIYEYDKNGEPRLIFSEKELEPEVRAKVNDAAKAVLSEMEKRGVGLKAENAGPFGHSIIFTLGTKMSDVKELAHLMESEMKAKGLDFEVEPRESKNPTVDPPYITFSKLNKSLATKHIAELKGIRAEEALILGDSMYKPNPDAKADPAIIARAEALSGQKIPLTGNLVDRNMELALPGALTLSVGATADPRMTNAWVMPVARDAKGKVLGPLVTHEILDAVASRRRGEEPPLHPVAAVAGFIALFGLAVFVWVMMGMAITGRFSPAAQPQSGYEYPVPPVSIDQIFR